MHGNCKMKMINGVFVISKQTTEKPHLIHCQRCGLKFKRGDEIFSKLTTRTRKRYHLNCAEKCNLMPEIVK